MLRLEVVEAVIEARLELGAHAELVPELEELARQVASGAHPVVLDLPGAPEARDLLARRVGITRVAAEPVATADTTLKRS